MTIEKPSGLSFQAWRHRYESHRGRPLNASELSCAYDSYLTGKQGAVEAVVASRGFLDFEDENYGRRFDDQTPWLHLALVTGAIYIFGLVSGYCIYPMF